MQGYGKAVGGLLIIIIVAAIWFKTNGSATRLPNEAVRVVAVSPPARPSTAAKPMSLTPSPLPPDPHRRALDDIATQFGPRVRSMYPESRALFERLLIERRDETWASRSETMLRGIYGEMPAVGGAGRTVDIACGATVCAVSGHIDEKPGNPAGAMLDALQSTQLMDNMMARGYQNGGASFGPDANGQSSFMTVWLRAPPEKPR